MTKIDAGVLVALQWLLVISLIALVGVVLSYIGA